MPSWLVAPPLAALVLAAAKAHGRQVRLEREAIGVLKVDFRGANDPRVEAIWRRDRRGFWSLFAGLALWDAAIVALLLANVGDAAFAAGWGLTLLAVAFALCFVAAGAWSWAKLATSAPDRAWLRAANLGSVAWWSLVAALLAVSVLAASI